MLPTCFLFSGLYVRVFQGGCHNFLKKKEARCHSEALWAHRESSWGPACPSDHRGQTLPTSTVVAVLLPPGNPSCPRAGFVYRRRNSYIIPGKYNMGKNV